ncbi:hypothetical protein [Streptomyces sp. RTd22]|nr:hypothetical protein [Streptomyces sp. RTd22]
MVGGRVEPDALDAVTGGPDQLITMHLTFEAHGSIGGSREPLEFAP